MSVRPDWCPGAKITILVQRTAEKAPYVVTLEGPTGSCSSVHTEWKSVISWTNDVVAGELGVAMGRIDEQLEKPVRAERHRPGEPGYTPRVLQFSDGSPMCDECCHGERCDDPSHWRRRGPNVTHPCPWCDGTGTPKLEGT